ncbi:ParB/RepB/Spo0J family partition protein [uncultured Pseudokineococcus sp.]|uniref:ParB/RepB/Spo0J family partition protein n=1 Tax=uncultured Pseudokineococcus sp. TaxID=1642928 RepID=UPI00260A9420|nr:ParB/RepB/Spo0J family partition protein [uncultured Pseudokineococcus sp.]
MDRLRGVIGADGGRSSLTGVVAETALMAVVDLGEALSPRRGPLDDAHVAELVQVLAALPPVLVHRGSLRVVDGQHRVAAARRSGATHVRVEYFDGDAEDAFVEAVRRNARHGLPLTLEDRRAAARRILTSHPDWSDGVVADHACLSTSTVAALRRTGDHEETPMRTGRDGRSRPVDGIARRRAVERYLADHPGCSLRQAAAAGGVSASTVKLVRDALGQQWTRGTRAVALVAEVTGPPVSEVVPCPSRAPDRGAPSRERRGGPGVPSSELVRRVSADPSFRGSEGGRTLLRVISLSVALVGDPRCVPVHRREDVAVLARRCAERWTALAVSLEDERSSQEVFDLARRPVERRRGV